MPRLIEPAHQGGVDGERLLYLLERRGLANAGLILLVELVLELDPLTAKLVLAVP